MLELMRSSIGLLIEIVTLIGGILSLSVAYFKGAPSSNRALSRQRWTVLGGALMATAAMVFVLRLAFPKPALAITTPNGSVDVQQPDAGKASVAFAVSGTSTGVPFDKCVYVLVKVASEWHVQECVQADETGSWSLPQAWIGDNSFPIAKGTTMHLMAVVAAPGLEKDRKLTHPQQLVPDATSRPVRVMVQSVQLSGAHASAD